jgi:hypothetical protein
MIEAAASLTAYDEHQKAEIQLQLERMLANPHFSHSRRFPSFLRFIVAEELEGRGDLLKERTLGVEVFGRDPGYDTTSDAIVRVTAAEIRKRIAQYYQESGNAGELRLSLPPGSYVPHFDWPKVAATQPAVPGLRTSPDLPLPPEALAAPVALLPATQLETRPRRWSQAVLATVAVAALAAAGWAWLRPRPVPLDSFWTPLISPEDPVTVCFPEANFNGITLRDANDPEQLRHLDEPWSGVVYDDLQPLVSISGLLEKKHQRYRLLGADAATLTDLRQGPAILIGAFDNAWTLRVTRGLRFRFGNNAGMDHFWIEDTHSAEHTRWSIDRNLQKATNNYRDYAIVARFRDAITGQLTVVAAGIARGGTVAAGEFLTEPGEMDSLAAQAPRNWAGQNMEIVLSTEIIDGKSSPPKVEATYFW